MAMPVYNGDRHICQEQNFQPPTHSLALPSLLFLSVLCALCGSIKSCSPSSKDCYILANIENIIIYSQLLPSSTAIENIN
ncbi:hypothetical protein [Microcoleus sp.]|uniref:hypothetical protein n=1 Tax=Microcoleus sp. TaxID=44472 RepID=UPI003592EB82